MHREDPQTFLFFIQLIDIDLVAAFCFKMATIVCEQRDPKYSQNPSARLRMELATFYSQVKLALLVIPPTKKDFFLVSWLLKKKKRSN